MRKNGGRGKQSEGARGEKKDQLLRLGHVLAFETEMKEVGREGGREGRRGSPQEIPAGSNTVANVVPVCVCVCVYVCK